MLNVQELQRRDGGANVRSPGQTRKSLLSTPSKQHTPVPDARAADVQQDVSNSEIDVDTLTDEYDARARSQAPGKSIS